MSFLMLQYSAAEYVKPWKLEEPLDPLGPHVRRLEDLISDFFTVLFSFVWMVWSYIIGQAWVNKKILSCY